MERVFIAVSAGFVTVIVPISRAGPPVYHNGGKWCTIPLPQINIQLTDVRWQDTSFPCGLHCLSICRVRDSCERKHTRSMLLRSRPTSHAWLSAEHPE